MTHCALSVRDFLEKQYPSRITYLSPWLKLGMLIMLYAGKSIGKTFFLYAIVIAIYYNRDLGTWRGETPVRCLYIDGEMPVQLAQERIRKMLPEGADNPFTIISSIDITHDGFQTPNLSNVGWRDAVTGYLRDNPEHKILILDNLVSLFPGIDTNNEVEWSPINQWLLSLRAMGIAVILVHHATKKGNTQRGTEHRQDNLDAILLLKRPEGYRSAQGARFEVLFERSRDLYGNDLTPFIFQLIPDPAKRVSLIAEGRYLDVKKECKTTLGELLKQYRENYQDQRSFAGSKEYCLENFKEYFGEDTLLSKIRYVDLETYRNHLKKKLTWRKHIRKDASVNREIACLHHLLAKGVEWEMIDKSPFDRGKSLLMKENNRRLRYLTREEIKKLLDASPEHLRNIIICAIQTGMRKSETLNLRWSQIRGGLIYLEKTKTDESRQVPISDELTGIFNVIKQKQKPMSEYVFLYDPTRGKPKKKSGKIVNLIVDNEKHPVKDIKTAFTKALAKSGIRDFRWHDLRHTAASHLVMNGAGLKDVQEILGHKSMSMTMRYSHLSQEHKKKAVNLLNGLTAFGTLSQTVTNTALTPPYEISENRLST